METITLHGHYDGSQIQIDDPFEMQPNTKVLITIVPTEDAERMAWHHFSTQGLASAYSNDEPEYALNLIKEQNPSYERG